MKKEHKNEKQEIHMSVRTVAVVAFIWTFSLFMLAGALMHMRNVAAFAVLSFLAGVLQTMFTVFVYKRKSNSIQQTNDDISRRLETALNSIFGGLKISRDDSNYSYIYVSEEAAAIQGYTVDEFMSVTNGNAVDNVYPPDLDAALKELTAQFEKGNTYSCRYRVRHRDGSLRWIVDSGMRVANKDGKYVHYSIYQDVTDYEEKNRELKDTYTMLRQMLSSLNNGVIAYRLPGREILMVNDEAKRLFKFEGDVSTSMMNEYITKNIMPDNSEAIRKAVRNLREPGDCVEYGFNIRGDDGGMLAVHACTKLLQFADGTRFIMSTVSDVTERVKLYGLLRRERQQYRDALRHNCEYSYSFDITTGIIDREFTTPQETNIMEELGLKLPVKYDELNERWLEKWRPRFIGGAQTELLKKQELIRRFENGEKSVEIEYYEQRFDMYIRNVILMSRSEENGHILGIVIAYDITERRKQEEQKKQELLEAKLALEEAYEAANRASAAKSKFLSSMSHDIRTPMNAIIGMTAIAGAHLDDRDRVADCLNKIDVSGRHLLGLINEVLDMSKIESGRVDLNEQEFSLAELIDTVLVLAKPQIEGKRHELIVSSSNIEHELVIGDGQRLQQSLLNLLSNAAKYTPDGGRIEMHVSEKPTNNMKVGCYEFIFKDNGIGMSREFQKRLFEPFSRAEDEQVRNEQGTGLGMAITRNIIQMMNGTIHIDSEPGEGTKATVTVYLKLQGDDETVSYEDFANLSVLVADGDEASGERLCRILEEFGMNNEWVMSGSEAVSLAAERHTQGNDYFAVILDRKMPVMDGIETTREIRRQVGPTVPIIISAYDWTDIEADARAAGADAFISKPLFKSRIADMFKRLLGHEIESGQTDTLDMFSHKDFSGRRVLLVEDNELNAEIAGEILKMAGLEIEYARNGKEAVEIMADVAAGYYSLIFMDVQMPVMNGYEAARAIRGLPDSYAREIPIIAMTANAFAEDVRNAINSGMNEHIMKPLDFKQLARVLEKWIQD